MKINILNSEIDIAGRNIRHAMDELIEQHGKSAFPIFDGNEVTFHTTPERIVNATPDVVREDADLVIVVSRHSSVNPVPVLTVHPPGNFGKALLGGGDFELGLTSPAWMKAILLNETKFVPDGYRVSYEITHHGPTNFKAPTLFVEVGSTEVEWNDSKAYFAVAKSVLHAKPVSDSIPIIGFGGTHYAVRQSAIGQETKGALGHMMHTRDVGAVTPEMVLQMVEKSGGVLGAHIDHKALSKPESSHIARILETLGIMEITEGDLLKLNNMSFETWVNYSKFAANYDKSFKIIPHGKIIDCEPAAITLPDDFFSAAFGRDDSALLAYLDSIGGVFHVTGVSGKVMPIFFTARENVRNVSVGLIALSIQQITRTQDCVVENDYIIITRRQFDAKLARTFGIPSGPLYGKLSRGETITLPDGRIITPDEVMMTTKTSIKIPGLEN